MNETLAQRKLQSIKKLPTEDEDFLTALNYVSDFYVHNNAVSRKQLKDDLEHRHLEYNNEFLKSFDALLEGINTAEGMVMDLRQCCEKMKDRVDETQENSKRIITYIDELQTQQQIASVNKQTVSSFLSHFQLSETETKLLQNGDISKPFFDALETLRRINSDCHALMLTQSHSTTLYVEIREQLSKLERSAFDRLCPWTKGVISSLGPDIVEFPGDFRMAMNALRSKEAMYHVCLTDIERCRAALMLQNFMFSLEKMNNHRHLHRKMGGGAINSSSSSPSHPSSSSSSSSSSLNTIEDPVRCIGDMLALIHQSIANEWELLGGLFSEKEHLEHTLSNIVAPLRAPLYDRTTIILDETTDITTLFQIANHFHFYSTMITNYVGPSSSSSSSSLHQTFSQCQSLAMKAITIILQRRADDLMLSPPVPPTDGAPHPTIREHMLELSQILKTIFSSLDESEDREAIVSSILNAVVEPLIQVCQLSATGLDEARMSVYLLNSLNLLDTCFNINDNNSPAIAKKHEKVNAQVEAYIDTAVQVEGRSLIKACKLEQLWVKLSPYALGKKPTPGGGGRLSSLPGLDPATVGQHLREFESSLLTDSVHQMPTLGCIQSPLLKAKARGKALDAVVNTYSCLYGCLNRPESGYGDFTADLLKYPVDQIRTILDA